MNKTILINIGSVVTALIIATSAYARNDINKYPLSDFFKDPDTIAKLDPNIKFKFGSGHGGNIVYRGLKSNKKANAFGKDKVTACHRALLSALLSFQKRALKSNSTKVINLVSIYGRTTLNSKTHFNCGVGNIMTGVAIRGDIAK